MNGARPAASAVDRIVAVRRSGLGTAAAPIEHEPAATEADAELAAIERAQRDPAAFAEIYDLYFPRVYGYVAARTRSRSDAEDVVADTFVRALGAVQRFEHRGAGSFAGWLLRIAHNRVLTKNAERREPAVQDADATLSRLASSADRSPEVVVEHAEEARLIRGLIQSLSPRRQEVVTLRFFAGLRNREIAEVLGLDERTVASHLCRALEDLRAKYLNATRQ